MSNPYDTEYTVDPTQPVQNADDLVEAKPLEQATEPGLAGDARANAAARLARGATKGQQGISYTQMPVPAPQNEAEYKLMPPGGEFLSPEGERLTKPWYPTSPEELEEVPDGMPYVGPDGVRRAKPTYEGVDLTPQTLYDMARSDKERFKILDSFYPGKVKKTEGTGKLYVDDDGTLRMPGKAGKGTDLVFPAIAAETAPMVGMVLGGRFGGLPGVAGGAMLGEGANAMLMQLAGYYDRTGDEALSGVAMTTAGAVVGDIAGRSILGVVTAWPAIREIASSGGAKVAANFVGALKDELDMALSIASKGEQESKSWLLRRMGMTDPGAIVPVSTWAKGAPALQNIVDAYEKALDTSNPMLRSIQDYYRKAVENVFRKFGIKSEGDVLNPTAAIPARETGEVVLAKAQQQMAEADANFQSKLAEVRLEKMRAQTSTLPEGFNVGEEELGEAGVAEGGRRVFNLHSPDGKVHFRGEVRPGETPGTWEIASVRNPSRKNKEMSPALYQEMARVIEAEGGTLVAGRTTGKAAKEALGRAAQQGLTTTAKGARPIRSQPDQKVMTEELEKAHKEAVDAAEAGIKAFVGDLKKDAAVFDELVSNGWQIGDFTRGFVAALQKTRNAIAESASKLFYGPSDEIAAGRLPEQSGLINFARQFYEDLPIVFREKHTPIANDIKKLGGGQDKEGNWLDAPEEMTYSQLRKMKSYLTREIDYDDLPSNTTNGTYKLFAKKIDEILHDAHASPELQEAARLADAGDAYYGRNMGPLNHLKFNALMRTLKGNLPPDPEALYDVFVAPGNTEMIGHVRDMVGPVLWNGVKAARLRRMFQQAATLENTSAKGIPEDIDAKKFADQVLSDHRNGVLASVFGQDAEKVQKAAQYLMAREGKFDLPVRPDDTIAAAMNRAKALGEAIEAAAKQDPLTVLESEVKAIEKQMAEAAKVRRNADPLDFLTDPTMGAVQAADRILASEDLITSAALKFGESSKEFGALQQLYVRRLLQSTDMEPYKALFPRQGKGGLEEKTQKLLFPGSTKEDILLLAKEMQFMLDNGTLDMARGFAAQSRVNNPWSQLPGHKLMKAATHVPLLGPVISATGRMALQTLYSTVRQVATSPSTMRFIRKGLEGDYAAKTAARKLIMDQWRQVARQSGRVAGEMQQGFENSGAEVDLDALGAERAPNGHYYLPDPDRKGKFLHVGQPDSGRM